MIELRIQFYGVFIVFKTTTNHLKNTSNPQSSLRVSAKYSHISTYAGPAPFFHWLCLGLGHDSLYEMVFIDCFVIMLFFYWSL